MYFAEVERRLTLERYDPDGNRCEVVPVANRADVARAVAGLGGSDPDQVLEFQVGDRSLTIATAGPDAFQVLALLDEDVFYDLVGDPTAEGFIEVPAGGQLSEVPRRHLVTKHDAEDVAEAFFEGGWIDRQRRLWERQGEYQSPRLDPRLLAD